MRLDANPCKNLFNKAIDINTTFDSTYSIRPNKMKEMPISANPNTTRFLLPKILIILPTIGLQMITATE